MTGLFNARVHGKGLASFRISGDAYLAVLLPPTSHCRITVSYPQRFLAVDVNFLSAQTVVAFLHLMR